MEMFAKANATSARGWLYLTAAGLLAAMAAACAPRVEAPPPPPPQAAVPTPALQTFTATAYTLEGKTASGSSTRPGVVAADPKILPLGTRIRVSEAGPYSGVYTVTDTGRAIRGRDIDIYIANDAEAKTFGRKKVRVEVLRDGDGGDKPARVSDVEPAGTAQ